MRKLKWTYCAIGIAACAYGSSASAQWTRFGAPIQCAEHYAMIDRAAKFAYGVVRTGIVYDGQLSFDGNLMKNIGWQWATQKKQLVWCVNPGIEIRVNGLPTAIPISSTIGTTKPAGMPTTCGFGKQMSVTKGWPYAAMKNPGSPHNGISAVEIRGYFSDAVTGTNAGCSNAYVWQYAGIACAWNQATGNPDDGPLGNCNEIGTTGPYEPGYMPTEVRYEYVPNPPGAKVRLAHYVTIRKNRMHGIADNGTISQSAFLIK